MTADNSARLQAIRARRAAITPAPWYAEPETRKTFPGYSIECADPDKTFDRVAVAYNIQLTHDALFIANAPADVDFLLSEVARLESENAALRKENEALTEGLDEFVRHQR